MKPKSISTLWIVLFATIIFAGTVNIVCAQTTSQTSCSHIKSIVYNDLMKQGQLSRDSAVLFLPAKDNNQAFKQAQNICIKLEAEMTQRDCNSNTYDLSDKTGKITIVNLKNDKNVYAIAFLKINCSELKIKEIRFISLKTYADFKKNN